VGGFRPSPRLRWNRAHALRKRRHLCPVVREMDATMGCRSCSQGDAGSPRSCGSNGSRHEAAAAVGANVAKDFVDAVGAKRTFVRADARLLRRRGQIPIAAFAVRPQVQCHVLSLGSLVAGTLAGPASADQTKISLIRPFDRSPGPWRVQIPGSRGRPRSARHRRRPADGVRGRGVSAACMGPARGASPPCSRVSTATAARRSAARQGR